MANDPADEPSTRQVRSEGRPDEFELRPLDPTVQQRYLLVWQELQEGFVDDPPETVRKAVDLIRRAMYDRGYPPLDFELRLGRTNTEELRQAFLHYRSLFSELLERDRITL
jgi:hypothetical protein